MYFFLVSGNMDSYLLAAMAIDRYVAICNPLHYVTVMNHGLYVATGLLHSFLLPSHSLLHVLLVNRLTFCASNVIHHFFCDVNPVLKLACSSTSVNEVVCHVRRVGFCDGPICLHHHLLPENPHCGLQNSRSCWKTQSLLHLQFPPHCGDSLLWEYLLCLPAIVSYAVKDRIVTVNYTVLTPMLNPFIYSLRNKDMKQGLEKLLSRIKFQMNRLSTTNSNKIHGT